MGNAIDTILSIYLYRPVFSSIQLIAAGLTYALITYLHSFSLYEIGLFLVLNIFL